MATEHTKRYSTLSVWWSINFIWFNESPREHTSVVWGCFWKGLTECGRHPSVDWSPRLKKEEAEHEYPSPALCFQKADAVQTVASHPCCHSSLRHYTPAVKSHTSNYEPKINRLLELFCYVYFIPVMRKLTNKSATRKNKNQHHENPPHATTKQTASAARKQRN